MRTFVRGSLRFLSSEVRGLQAAAYILAFSALLSSLLALVRDRIFAAQFGAGVELDIYYAAFRIPDLLFVVTGALVSAYVLIPELSRRSEEDQRRYIDTVVAAFSLLAAALSAVAAYYAPQFLAALFPDLAAAGHGALLAEIARILLLQPVLLGFSNILAAITQARQRYALYSVSPLLYNAGIIFGVLVFYPVLGLPGLAWGVVLGASLHLGIQLPAIVSDGFLRRIPILREPRALLATAAISIPRAMTLAMTQVIFLGLTSLAAALAQGSIAVFIFAFNLQAVPLSVIGASYSVAAFPMLAASIARGMREDFVEHIAIAARYVLFWSLPASALALVLRAHLVRVILGSGAFDWTDTRLTAAAFALLALSLPAQGLTLLLARGYYAAGKTLAPFAVAVLGASSTIGLAAYLVGEFGVPEIPAAVQVLLRLEDVPGSSVLALAFAYACVSIVSTLALAALFEHRFGGLFRRIRWSLLQSLLAAVAAGSCAYAALFFVGPLTLDSTLASVFLRGAAGGLAGIAAAALAYWLMGNKEFADTVAGMQSRQWRIPQAQPIASAEEAAVSGPQ